MRIRYVLTVMLLTVALPGRADVTETVARAIEDGTVKVSFRYRYELVDDASFAREANASTLKSRLTFAPRFNDEWSAVIEFDDVRQVGAANFSDTRNGKTQYPTVLDPEGTNLNQAYVRYNGLDNSALTLGRQRINRGDQRFIGGVGWRQNEQTYDSFSVAYGDRKGLQAFYAYVFQVDRIFGPEKGSPARRFDSDSHLLDVNYAVNDTLDVSAYGYLLDLENGDGFSNATYGLRAKGRIDLGKSNTATYLAEVARQADHGDNPVNYDADYLRLEAGAALGAFNLNAGYEMLGGADVAGGGFRTPLATLHKFQGWADKFAAGTAGGLDSGLRDMYASVTLKSAYGNFRIVYHDFEADKGGTDLGSEFDASASWTFNKHYGLLLKMARFNGKGGLTDLNKIWLQLTAKF